MKTFFSILWLAAFCLVPFAAGHSAQNDWKQEFEDLCSRTQAGYQPEAKEIPGLLSRCDALQARVDKLEDPQRKVMRSRLKRCCDYYAYQRDISNPMSSAGTLYIFLTTQPRDSIVISRYGLHL
jgi:hypothetical protein